MGCFPFHFLTGCSLGTSKIKILTVEGKCYKFDAPMIVKEVLVDFPSHVLFHSETVRKLGTKARPLQRTLYLQPGEIYFLVPKSTTRISQPSQQPSAASLLVSQKIEPSHNHSKRKVSFAPTQSSWPSASTQTLVPADVSSSSPSVQILPSPSDGVVRLKMVVSKRHLTSVLEEHGDSAAMVEGLLSPLLREAEAQSLAPVSSTDDCAWRPALESIPESP